MPRIPKNLKLTYKAYAYVLFEGVPMRRALAWALLDARLAGVPFIVNSASRKDSVVRKFRGKGLRNGYSSQVELYTGFAAGRPGFFPANRPGTSSHEGRSDGNAFYGVALGGVIPEHMEGIDAVNAPGGDAAQLVAWLNSHGYEARRVYPTDNERHHFSFSKSPATNARKRLAKAAAADAKEAAAKRAAAAKKAAATRLKKSQLGAAAVAKRNGIGYALTAIRIADKLEHVGRPLAIAMLEQESGGRNVFGHDPTIYSGAGKVTEAKYKAYRAWRRGSNNTKMQGVGPLQLTWWQFQDEADAMGGCWKPAINIEYGLRKLDKLIATYGREEGIKRYNGSGAAANAYSLSVRAKADKWAARLT